jgi:hypothetical protein
MRQLATYVAIVLLIATALIHLKLYDDGYKDFPNANLGRSFLLNAVACATAAVALWFHRGALSALAGLAVINGTLLGFALSRTDRGVFEFTERGFDPAPEAVLSLVVEIGAAIALLAVLALDTRDARLAR